MKGSDYRNLGLLYENILIGEGFKSFPRKIEHINKAKMYWAYNPNTGTPPIGFSIPKWKPSRPEFVELEKELENVRLKINPDAPSRLNCIFLCPDLSGWCDCGGYNKKVCEVEATGKIFIADYEDYTLISDTWRGRRPREDFQRYAERYWELGGGSYYPEVLLDGNAVVVGYSCNDK